MIVGVHGTLPAYIEVDTETGEVIQQGLSGQFSATHFEFADNEQNGLKDTLTGRHAEIAREITENDTFRGEAVEWPGWDWS